MKTNTVWIKTKSLFENNSWILWIFILFGVISFYDGINTGLLSLGFMFSGVTLGIIIPKIFSIIIGKGELKIIYFELIIFIISTSLLYFNVQNKRLLIYIVPFSIPIIISTSIIYIKNKLF